MMDFCHKFQHKYKKKVYDKFSYAYSVKCLNTNATLSIRMVNVFYSFTIEV